MAAPQATAATTNLLAGLDGRPSDATFRVEPVCIVHGLDDGTLIRRTPQRNGVLPPSRLLHWAKRGFERRYLARYR